MRIRKKPCSADVTSVTLRSIGFCPLGTQVTFESPKRGHQFDTLIKINRKTVVVLTEDRRQCGCRRPF